MKWSRRAREIEGDRGQSWQGLLVNLSRARESLRDSKPLKEEMRFVFFTDSNCPPAFSAQVSGDAWGRGGGIYPQIVGKRNHSTVYVRKLSPHVLPSCLESERSTLEIYL